MDSQGGTRQHDHRTTSGVGSAAPLLFALDELEEVIGDNRSRLDLMVQQLDLVREQLRAGSSMGAILGRDDGISLTELTRQNLDAISTAGAAVRRLQALALYREGWTMQEIGEAFCVSRQRVAELLQCTGTGRRRDDGGSGRP